MYSTCGVIKAGLQWLSILLLVVMFRFGDYAPWIAILSLVLHVGGHYIGQLGLKTAISKLNIRVNNESTTKTR